MSITCLVVHVTEFQSLSENAVPIADLKLMRTNLQNQEKKKTIFSQINVFLIYHFFFHQKNRNFHK